MEKIQDFISGLDVNATQEEVNAVQPFSKILVEDYGYPKNDLQTHPQIRVKSSPSDLRGYPIDIAVFEKRGTPDEKLYIVVECKKPNRKDGRDQLELYLKFSSAKIGVWYNGNESLYLRKIEESGNIQFEEIPAIPKHGETLEEIGKYRRKDLHSTHNLKEIFQEIRGYLAANNTGTGRDEIIAKSMIHLILCKIYDERFTSPDDMVTFRSEILESDEDVKNRIDKLFQSVKAKYRDVLEPTDTIDFDGRSLRHVVSKLQNFCVTETKRDVVSDAFEVFIGYSLKGDSGQFFTPANVIKLMVRIADIKRNDVILDPTCGSGGFLVESLRKLWDLVDEQGKKFRWSDSAIAEEKKEAGIKNIRGIDKDPFLSKVTKSYMAILGDGKGGIFSEDSLERPENWKESTQSLIKLGSFDVVLTNPPFGKNIKVTGKDKLMQYELAKKMKGDEVTNTYVSEGNVSTLFLERDLQLLKPGGRLGVILPETYFHAPSQRRVFDFLFEGNNVYYVVDLPQNTFRPYNNAKCIIVFVQKGRPQQEYINMAVAEEVGHNHLGEPMYRFDEKGGISNKIWDDIELIQDELNSPEEEGEYTFSVKADIVKERHILVPRYYWNTRFDDLERMADEMGMGLVSMQQLIDEGIISTFDGNGSPEAQFKGTGEIPYIRVKDIVNWQVYTDVTSLIPASEYERLYRADKQLVPKDILYVRRGSYRIGSVAMVSPYNLKCILTREILVIRVNDLNNKYGITPEYLLYALSHKITFEESKNKIFIDTTLPNIAERWKEVKIPYYKDEFKYEQIKKMCEEIVQNHWKATADIEEFRNKYNVYCV